MRHGTETAYRRHLADGEPFPEDNGGISCGCRMAHRLIPSKRAKYGVSTCNICGHRCMRHDDRLCGECRKAVKDRGKEPEEELELTGGGWVRVGLTMRWFPELRSIPGKEDSVSGDGRHVA